MSIGLVQTRVWRQPAAPADAGREPRDRPLRGAPAGPRRGRGDPPLVRDRADRTRPDPGPAVHGSRLDRVRGGAPVGPRRAGAGGAGCRTSGCRRCSAACCCSRSRRRSCPSTRCTRLRPGSASPCNLGRRRPPPGSCSRSRGSPTQSRSAERAAEPLDRKGRHPRPILPVERAPDVKPRVTVLIDAPGFAA